LSYFYFFPKSIQLLLATMFTHLACLFFKKILFKCLSLYHSFGGVNNILAIIHAHKNLDNMLYAIRGLLIVLVIMLNLFFYGL